MKDDLRKDLYNLLKQWWKPRVTSRRRNILDLFKECELYNPGERIRVITKRSKVEKEYEAKYQEVWSKLGITLPWLVTHKKFGQGNFIECVARDNWLLTCWKEQWSSGLLCEPDAHPGRVLNRCYRNSVFSYYFPFHDQQNCYSQALSSGIHMPLGMPDVQNSHTLGCFCCPSLTWSQKQRGHSKEPS